MKYFLVFLISLYFGEVFAQVTKPENVQVFSELEKSLPEDLKKKLAKEYHLRASSYLNKDVYKIKGTVVTEVLDYLKSQKLSSEQLKKLKELKERYRLICDEPSVVADNCSHSNKLKEGERYCGKDVESDAPADVFDGSENGKHDLPRNDGKKEKFQGAKAVNS